jgi:hypothetical protein
MCCKTTRLENTNPVPRRQVRRLRKNERVKERKKKKK